jgi:hypothetical protein
VVFRLPGRTSAGHGPRWSANDADDARARRPRHGPWRSRRSRAAAVDSSAAAAPAPGPLARRSGQRSPLSWPSEVAVADTLPSDSG